MKKLKIPFLTVDGVLVQNGKVLMVKRAHYPFIGSWVLPGGRVEYGESTEKAIKREMKEELGIPVKIKKLIGVYSEPWKRDPRGHTVSVAYSIKRIRGKIHLDREASEFKFFPLNKLPKKVGFDHRRIISDFKKAKN